MVTLASRWQLQQEIRKSRFLAQAAPVDDDAAADTFIAEVSDRGATHNCWAWRLGNRYRFNDDGEPGGSAGRPILAAIDGQGLDHVVVVVTRWFGGIKLGVGGLVRAYGGCAAECLRTAPRRTQVEQVRIDVRCGYADAPMIYARKREFEAQRVDEASDAEAVKLTLDLPRTRLDAFDHFIRDLTRARGSLTVRT